MVAYGTERPSRTGNVGAMTITRNQHTDGDFEPYFELITDEFLPKFQKKTHDFSDETAKTYREYVRRHYLTYMRSDLYGSFNQEELLERNYENSRRHAIDSISTLSAQQLLLAIQPPDPELEKTVNTLHSYCSCAESLAFATVLGKVSPAPTDYEAQMEDFRNILMTVPPHRRPADVSETIENIACAYGQKPLWQAPMFDHIHSIATLDEGSLRGYVGIRMVRRMLRHELSGQSNDGHVTEPADFGPWEERLGRGEMISNEEMYGDPSAEIEQALEWRRKAIAEAKAQASQA